MLFTITTGVTGWSDGLTRARGSLGVLYNVYLVVGGWKELVYVGRGVGRIATTSR